ncbi:MAG TPA: hypothetical protein VGM86_26820 [Thermoanaerobaculia bacterium]|jgi:hypothetical protein
MSVEIAGPRSPLYEAIHARRYQRQDLIRTIEGQTGRRLGVYFANINHGDAGIFPGDISPFQDLLFDCEADCDLDLLLQSPGGDIDSAEKLVYMIREKVRSLRIIVVERAKSAATLIALASDEILMSSTSELGPIDPQVTISAADGRPLQRPARSFLDGLEQVKRSVASEGELNPAYYPLLSQLDPALLDFCEKAIRRSEQFAEKWLVRFMLRDHPEHARKIAKRLTDVEQYRSHGMVIDWREAKDMGLNVTFLASDHALWHQLWGLFLAYQIECNQQSTAKIFETRKVSLAW